MNRPEHFVVHAERLGIRPVDLVDGDDRPEAQCQRLSGDEPGLRHGPLRRVHQDQHAVHHPKDSLHLTTEIGVPRGVHDVDLHPVPTNCGVLGQDGDAAFPFQRVRVHDPLFDLLVGAEGTGLSEHLIDQRRLAVVDVSDDGQIPDHAMLPYPNGTQRFRPGYPGLRGAYID